MPVAGGAAAIRAGAAGAGLAGEGTGCVVLSMRVLYVRLCVCVRGK